ncbi:MAG: EpsI family protein [Burkholderiaceae bacterium]|nr:EpsI family protein [Burkholderiaceae bacterium]
MKRALWLMTLMLSASVAALALTPRRHLADVKPKIDLEEQVPVAFGDWRIDRTIVPILPSPDVQQRLDALYSQVLARTYVNSRGDRVMLSIAYGSDQASEATQVHRPEFCYAAQGFAVSVQGEGQLELEGLRVPVRRIVGTQQSRVEPITYWVTLDEQATLPGLRRKLIQIREGLLGRIPDGMLVRVSSIDTNPQAAYALQERFVAEMRDSVPQQVRSRFFGRGPG